VFIICLQEPEIEAVGLLPWNSLPYLTLPYLTFTNYQRLV